MDGETSALILARSALWWSRTSGRVATQSHQTIEKSLILKADIQC
jgi:hypothetical protein